MQGIVKQRRGLIETPHAKLDALVYTNLERGGGAAVILHPYALLGGSMQDPMVTELFRAAAASPAFSLVVRYNQRGVGRSSGNMNVRGKEDMVDALDVVEWAAEQLPGSDKQVAVIGYSWGSCLATHALSHPSVAAYVGVSFPLGGLSFVLQTKKHFGEVCRASHVPRLLIVGDQDQFTKEAALRQAVVDNGGALLRQDDSFQPQADSTAAAGSAGSVAPAAAAEGAAPGPVSAGGMTSSGSSRIAAVGGSSPGPALLPGAERKQLLLRVFPDSDHFWMSYGSLAAEYAIAWLETLVHAQPRAAAEGGGAHASVPDTHEPQVQESAEAAAAAQATAPEPAVGAAGAAVSAGPSEDEGTAAAPHKAASVSTEAMLGTKPSC